MISGSDQDVDEARLIEAAAWRVRLTEEDLHSCEAFEDWRSEPANAEAWQMVQAPWAYVGEVANSPDLMALRARALDRAAGPTRRATRVAAIRRVMPLAAAIAGVLLFGAAVLGSSFWLRAQPEVYVTAQGERKVIQLADMSRVSMDAGTELRVLYTDGVRRLELVSGQARFDVAKDAKRPFIVKAKEQEVVATGTAFNVDLLGQQTLVTLLEGHVTVLGVPTGSPAKSAKAPAGKAVSAPVRSSMDMKPGQQLVVSAGRSSQLQQIDPDRATSWQVGELIFVDEPLPEAAARVSRYGATTIIVHGIAQEKRISGVFKLGDTVAFVGAVTALHSISASTNEHGQIILR